MDTMADKNLKALPKWTERDGPGYLAAYARKMGAFMARNDLMVFMAPNVASHQNEMCDMHDSYKLTSRWEEYDMYERVKNKGRNRHAVCADARGEWLNL